MKFTNVALAASLVFGHASAQEKAPCVEVTQDMPWNVFIVHQMADTVNNKFCLEFNTSDERVKNVVIKVDDGKGATTVAKENCLDIKGAANQTLTPVITFADDDTRELPALGMVQATEVYTEMSQACIAAHPSSYMPINFSLPLVR